LPKEASTALITRHIHALGLAVIVVLSGCGSGNSTATDPGKVPQGVRCSEYVGSSCVLDSGVSLTCTLSDPLVCTLRYRTESKAIALQRDADVWGLAACPGFVLVLDRFASNEDRLLLIDLSASPPREKEIIHEDWSNYIHAHFSMISGSEERVVLQESQYAGSRPPRFRTIEVSLKSLSLARVGPWLENVER
jgi:hypothetical protein